MKLLLTSLFITALLASAGAHGQGSPAEPQSSAAQRLGAAIRIRTVSHADPADRDTKAFLRFHEFLRRSFPAAHHALARERVNELSLLYSWRGSDPALPPLLLTAHFDVVPVPEDARDRWEHDPFGGEIAEGYVWGRGALDDKIGVMAMLESVERLVAAGFAPRRTVLLAFGHDEEVGGAEGAGATAALLEQRGVRPWMSIDEGLAIISRGGFGGLQVPVALVGVAEKGFVTLRVTAHAVGGHSSMPPRKSAIGKLARAIEKIEENPLPVHLDGLTGDLLDALSEHQPFLPRFFTRNRWLTGPLLARRLTASPGTNAMVRTTTAVTMVNGGVKENVLPSEATATINFRVLPGDTSEYVVDYIRDLLGPEYAVAATRATEPSPVSSVDSDAYELIRSSVDAVFPGTAVAPGLVMGGTDTRHYIKLVEHAYRFTPMELTLSDGARIHGVNERMSVTGLARAIDFYAHLIETGAGGQ